MHIHMHTKLAQTGSPTSRISLLLLGLAEDLLGIFGCSISMKLESNQHVQHQSSDQHSALSSSGVLSLKEHFLFLLVPELARTWLLLSPTHFNLTWSLQQHLKKKTCSLCRLTSILIGIALEVRVVHLERWSENMEEKNSVIVKAMESDNDCISQLGTL